MFDLNNSNDTVVAAEQVATIFNPSPIQMIPAGVLSFGLDFEDVNIGGPQPQNGSADHYPLWIYHQSRHQPN